MPVSLDARAPPVDGHDYDLWSPTSANEARLLPVRLVPTLILVRGNGTVLGVWSGEVTPDRVEEIVAEARLLTATAANE